MNFVCSFVAVHHEIWSPLDWSSKEITFVSQWCISKKPFPDDAFLRSSHHHIRTTRGKEEARSYIWDVLDLGLGKEIGNWVWNPTMKVWTIVHAMLPSGSNAQVIRMVLACKRISPMSWPLGILEWVNGSSVATHINFLHSLHYFRMFFGSGRYSFNNIFSWGKVR